jgi:hypothetical protein
MGNGNVAILRKLMYPIRRLIWSANGLLVLSKKPIKSASFYPYYHGGFLQALVEDHGALRIDFGVSVPGKNGPKPLTVLNTHMSWAVNEPQHRMQTRELLVLAGKVAKGDDGARAASSRSGAVEAPTCPTEGETEQLLPERSSASGSYDVGEEKRDLAKTAAGAEVGGGKNADAEVREVLLTGDLNIGGAADPVSYELMKKAGYVDFFMRFHQDTKSALWQELEKRTSANYSALTAEEEAQLDEETRRRSQTRRSLKLDPEVIQEHAAFVRDYRNWRGVHGNDQSPHDFEESTRREMCLLKEELLGRTEATAFGPKGEHRFWTWDSAANELNGNGNAHAGCPSERVDHLLALRDSAFKVTKADVVMKQLMPGYGKPISDHYGMLFEFDIVDPKQKAD